MAISSPSLTAKIAEAGRASTNHVIASFKEMDNLVALGAVLVVFAAHQAFDVWRCC